MSRTDEYNALDRDTLIDRLKSSVTKVTDFLTEKKIAKDVITSATLGTYFLFSISDNFSDSKEYQFFIQAFNVPVPADDYRELARQSGTPENIRKYAGTAQFLCREYPEISADIEQIALCAIAANGTITESEERFFDMVFGG